MDSSTWQRLEQAFAEASALSGEAREHYLAEFAAAQPGVIDELRSLLAADGDDSLMSRVVGDAAHAAAAGDADRWIGERLGAWTVIERIADGGMGSVFLAERADAEYQQQAAIKLMGAQLVAQDAAARFRTERQILARLSHPGIAKLLDGGTTADKLPFLVMEYIAGEPVDTWCDGRQLGLDERLRVLVRICDAVDYAHRQLIVHRDIKPGNILIDERGDPKLLDFGIARLIEPSAVDAGLTRAGARPMTPEYASPEQVRGETPTVATDVYALGVLMFRLLTGQSPYATDPTSAHEFEAAIVQGDVRRPSTVVTREPTVDESLTAATLSDRRATSPGGLRRRLTGDLDNIVLKALQKEPERRYQTARQLAEDIERYLAHQPVLARPDSLGYRAGKFVRRHASALGITAAVLLGVVGLVSYYTWQLAEERDRANLQAAKATQVAGFLSTLFETASPVVRKGEDITVVDLLEQGVIDIDALADQPALQADLFQVIGGSLTSLEQHQKAVEILARSRALHEQLGSPTTTIADLYHAEAEAQRQRGNYVEAEAGYRQALRLRREALGEPDAVVAYTIARVAVASYDQGRRLEALPLYEQALAMHIAAGGEADSERIDIMGNLSNALVAAGRMDDAIAMLRETLALSAVIDGELHPNTIIRNTNLGLWHNRMGKHREALGILETSWQRGLQTWPDGHTHMDFILGQQGRAHKALGDMSTARAAYEAAVDNARRIAGPDSERHARRLRSLGAFYIDVADYEEASRVLDESRRLYEALDVGGFQARAAAFQTGRLLNRTGRFAEAVPFLQAARVNTESTDMIGIDAAVELATARRNTGDAAAAGELLADAVAALDAIDGLSPVTLAGARVALARHHRETGALDAAAAAIEQAQSLIFELGSDWRRASVEAEHAQLLRARGDAAGADRRATTVYCLLLDVLGAEHPDTRAIRPADSVACPLT